LRATFLLSDCLTATAAQAQPQSWPIDRGERTSMIDEDERRITDDNLSEGMAIDAETLRAPAVNSQTVYNTKGTRHAHTQRELI